MRTVSLIAIIALAAPALAGRALLEEAAAPATAPLKEKAEATLSFGAGMATMKDGVLTFSSPTEDVATSAGSLKTAEAFAPGHFDAATTGDAVLTGVGADGKAVKAVVRLAEPTFVDGKDGNKVVVARAVPLSKDAPAILVGGEVAKAKADLQTAAALPADVAFVLTDARVVVDSTAATEPAADGEKHGFVGSVIGASIGNRLCHGSWVCAATGAHIGYHGR